MNPPHLTYYTACVGEWRAPLELEVIDRRALAETMGWLDSITFVILAFLQRTLGGFYFDTSVEVRSDTHVVHTTRLRFLGIYWMSSREELELDPDGRSFTIRGEGRMLTMPWRRLPVSGTGVVADDSMSASYQITWFDTPFEQNTVRRDGEVTLEQSAPGLRSRQALHARNLLT